MQILLIDDDRDAREVLGLVLRSEGHRVEESADGVEAIGCVRAGFHPDLIFLDMMMPRLDGEGFLNLMRFDPRLSGTSIVITSGHPLARRKASELGADGCLAKPIELEDLLSLVHRIGDESRTQPAPAH